MSTYVLKQTRLYVAQYDLTGDFNQHDSQVTVDAVESTTFGAGGTNSRSYLPGLDHLTFTHTGYMDPDGTTGPDDVEWSNIASTVVTTIAPDGTTSGNVAYTTQRTATTITPLTGAVGEMAGFVVSGQSSGPVVRGTVMVSDGAAITATGNGTGYQVGSIAATENGYASLHVVAASGTTPTLDVVIESDDNAGFTSATSRITFTQATGITSEWASVAGAVTDDYWRATYTLGGTSPSFTFLVTFGIR